MGLCRVASRSSASEAAALKRRHYQWLLQTGQDEEAGRVKERDGDFVGAISLFLKGGLPGKAAQVWAKGGHCSGDAAFWAKELVALLY